MVPATADQLLAIRVNAGIAELAEHDRFAAAEPDLVEAIVEGIGQFAAGEFAPLNRVGDKQGAVLENGTVRLPDGYGEAYRDYVARGRHFAELAGFDPDSISAIPGLGIA